MISFIASVALLAPGVGYEPIPEPTGWRDAFVPNAGQWDSRALYRFTAANQAVWITNDGARIDQYEIVEGVRPGPHVTSTPIPAPIGTRGHAVELRFEGGRAQSITPRARGRTRLNYYLGADPERWSSGLHPWGAVTQREVYPGIDVDWTPAQASARFDFHLAPGANPDLIRVRLVGAEAVRAQGDTLEYRTRFGWGRLASLRAFQPGPSSSVPVRFVEHRDGTFGFRLGAYDTSRPLVIDPLIGGSYLSRSGDLAYSVSPYNGRLLVAGIALEPRFPVTLGAYDTSHNGSYDAYVALVEPLLDDVYAATFLGGPNADYGSDGSTRAKAFGGNIYLFGPAGDGFPTLSAYDTTFNGGSADGFVARLNGELSSLLNSSYVGGSDYDEVSDIAYHRTGAVGVLLTSNSNNVPMAGVSYDSSYNGSYDMALFAFNSSLTALASSTYLGGATADLGRRCLFLGSSRLMIVGQTDSTGYPLTSDSFKPGVDGRDIAITVLTTNLSSLMFSGVLGGTGDEGGVQASGDISGDLWLAASTLSSDAPTTAGAYRATRRAPSDTLLYRVRLSPPSLIYGTYMGVDSVPMDVVAGPGSAPTVAGICSANGLERTTPGAIHQGPIASSQAFLARMTPDLKRYSYATYFQTIGYSAVYSLFPEGENAMAIAGSGVSMPTTPGGMLATGSGTWVGRVLSSAQPSAITLMATGATKTTHYWRTLGGVITGWRNSGTVPTGWTLVGHEDFNGDEYDDLVVQRTSDGALGAYLLTATGAVSAWQSLGRVASGWRVAALGDVDGDGNADMLLERTADRVKGAWLMRGPTIVGWRKLGVPGTLLAAGDIDADGWTDLIYQDGTLLGAAIPDGSGYHPGEPEALPAGTGFVGLFQGDGDAALEVLLWDASARNLLVWEPSDGGGPLHTLTAVAAAYAPVGTGRLY